MTQASVMQCSYMSNCAAPRKGAAPAAHESAYQQGITMRVLGHLVCIHPGAGMQILRHQ